MGGPTGSTWREIEAACYPGGPDGRTHRVHRRGRGGQERLRGKCDCGRMVRGRLLCWPRAGGALAQGLRAGQVRFSLPGLRVHPCPMPSLQHSKLVTWPGPWPECLWLCLLCVTGHPSEPETVLKVPWPRTQALLSPRESPAYSQILDPIQDRPITGD